MSANQISEIERLQIRFAEWQRDFSAFRRGQTGFALGRHLRADETEAFRQAWMHVGYLKQCLDQIERQISPRAGEQQTQSEGPPSLNL